MIITLSSHVSIPYIHTSQGGYIEGKTTFTVKLATVSFYKNLAKGLPPGAGVFVVCDAINGAPVGVFQVCMYDRCYTYT